MNRNVTETDGAEIVMIIYTQVIQDDLSEVIKYLDFPHKVKLQL